MYYKSRVLILIITFVAFIFGAKPFYSAAQSLLILTDEQSVYPLGLHLQILEDPSRELTLEDVTSPEMSPQFQPSVAEIPNYGFTDSVYWARITLANNATEINTWWLEVDFPALNAIDLYQISPSGALLNYKQAGTIYPSVSRDMIYHTHLLKLSLPVNTSQIIYIRFENAGAMRLPLTLYTPLALTNKIRFEQLKLGAFYGILFVLVIYNLFLFLSLRDKDYFYFMVFTLSFMVSALAVDGIMPLIVGPKFSLWSQYFTVFLSTLTGILAFQFGAKFLEIKKRLPAWHKLVLFGQAGFAIIIVSLPFSPVKITSVAMLVLLLLCFFSLMVFGIFIWRQGYRSARYFVLGWGLFFVGMAATILARLAVIPASNLSLESPRLAIIGLFVLLSLALVDRINLFRDSVETANRNLQASELRLFQILEAMPVGVTVRGVDTKLYYINQLGRKLLGYDNDTAEPDIAEAQAVSSLNTDLPYFISGTNTPYPREKLPPVQALQGQTASVDDMDIQLPNRRFPIEVWASPIFDEANKVQSVVSAFMDITDRKEAEAILQENEARFRSIFEDSATGMALVNPDHSIFRANAAFYHMLGYAVNEIEGNYFKNITHPDDIELSGQNHKNLFSGKINSYQFEKRYLHKQGHIIWALLNVSAVRSGQGKVLYAIAQIQDITERKLAEQFLRQSEARLKTIINNIPFDMWVCDAEGYYILQNARSFDIAGDVIGNTIDHLDLPPELKADYKAKHQRALQGETVREEVEILVKGKLLTVDSIQTPIFDDGQIIGFLGMNIDITERKETEKALQAYATELERSNRELQNFAYVSSHDLQEPLRKIQTFGNRLEHKYSARLDETGRDYLQRMQSSAARMQRLIQDLLAFSRVTNSAESFALVDLQEILEGVLSDLETQTERVKGRVIINPLPKIEADSTQMQQLFQNLISNSLKFHRPGVAPLVEIECQQMHPQSDRGDCYKISVKDNGIGFDEKYLDRIFGVFQRLHNRAEYEGTGIGLAICRRVVERHGGEITAHSQPGAGAEFIITLPARQNF